MSTINPETAHGVSRPRLRIAVLAIALCLSVWSCGKSASKSPADLRIAKAKSMIKDDSVKKLRKDDLIAAFGSPNADGYFQDWDNAFNLGIPTDSYSIDSTWIVVNYGDDGLVCEARMAMD